MVKIEDDETKLPKIISEKIIILLIFAQHLAGRGRHLVVGLFNTNSVSLILPGRWRNA